MPVEIFMRQGGWASISKGSVNSRDDVKIDNIPSHPVGPIPVSMFHEDGTTRKSCKSNLVKQFENEVVVGSKVSKGSMLLFIHALN
jgi:hypothetical protein